MRCFVLWGVGLVTLGPPAGASLTTFQHFGHRKTCNSVVLSLADSWSVQGGHNHDGNPHDLGNAVSMLDLVLPQAGASRVRGSS